MKKSFALTLVSVAALTAASSASAFWGNDGWGNGWGNNWNPYDPWDPRFWMEEMENFFDGNNGWGDGPWGGYGPYGYGAPYGGGYGMPYGPPPPFYGPGPVPYGYMPAPAPAPQQNP